MIVYKLRALRAVTDEMARSIALGGYTIEDVIQEPKLLHCVFTKDQVEEVIYYNKPILWRYRKNKE